MIYAHIGQALEAGETRNTAQEQAGVQTPQVAQGMNVLGRQIASLNESLDRLIDRLAPVLRPADPVPQDKASGNSQSKRCPLAEYINEHINAVLKLEASLQYLHDHLEL